MAPWILASLAHAQVVPNPGFTTTAPSSIPNTGTISGWTLLNGADVGQVGVDIDCADILTNNSKNGGQFVRAVSEGITTQGVSATVTGLTIGVAYRVRFEQALVRHLGQSTGHWNVEFAMIQVEATDLALPAAAANPAQTAWRTETVGPFPAVATEATLIFTAISNADGGTNTSPDLPTDACDYPSKSLAADLLLDGIEVIPDTDGDGLFDDEEEALGTDPEVADTDADTLTDGDEVDPAVGSPLVTDPLDPDTDGDALLDGVELLVGANPLIADTDEDGLSDGDELSLGTSPILADTDGDGVSDADEVEGGSDPLDPESVPVDPTVPTIPTTDSGTEPTGGGDTDTGGKSEDGGCGCAANGAASPASLGLAALGALIVRRRPPGQGRRAGAR